MRRGEGRRGRWRGGMEGEGKGVKNRLWWVVAGTRREGRTPIRRGPHDDSRRKPATGGVDEGRGMIRLSNPKIKLCYYFSVLDSSN